MRILICGDRNWSDVEFMRAYFRNFPRDTLIIEGEQRGADIIARELAKEFGFEFLPFPADWTGLGRKAGPIRNRQMLREGKPDMVLAFHDDLEGRSRGTKDMVKAAREAGVRTYVITHQRPARTAARQSPC